MIKQIFKKCQQKVITKNKEQRQRPTYIICIKYAKSLQGTLMRKLMEEEVPPSKQFMATKIKSVRFSLF